MSRRVVITGLGAVTPLGIGVAPLWEGMCAGRSGLRPIGRFDASGFACRLAGEVPEFSAKDFVPKHYRKAVKVMARDIELAVGAAKEAFEDAGMVTRATLGEDATTGGTYPGARLGCHIGAGLISADADELAAALATARREDGTVDLEVWGSSGMENMTPLWMLKYLPNMVASHVTILHGCEGPSNTITCAEASGILSIGESVRAIERGAADACISGGAESKLNLMGLLRSEYAGRAAPTGDATDGAQIVRPFDANSPGGLMGEAAGLVIVEAVETAAKRGAKVYAEVAGLGAGHSPMRPVLAGRPDSLGANAPADEGFQAAIENAIADAGITPEQIGACVMVGYGVPALDFAEAGALRAIFGAGLKKLPLVTIGPNVGNCWAGTAGVLAVVAARCIKEQRLPARVNTGSCAGDVDGGAAPSREARLGYVLAVAGSLGGQNAAMILKAV